MTNPQRKVDRLTRDRLSLYEMTQVYPRSFIAPLILIALVLLAIFTHGATVWFTLSIVYGTIAFACAPLIFEAFGSQAQRRAARERRAEMRRRRGLKRGKPRLIVVPEGEHVTIHTWAPRWGGAGWNNAEHESVSFHAEDQDKQAQEYVSEFRAHDYTPSGKRVPSSEAQALAKVLNR